MTDQGRARRRARGAFFTSNAAIIACAALAVAILALAFVLTVRP